MPNITPGGGTPAQIVRTANCKKKVLLVYAAWGRFSEVDTIPVTSDEVTAITMVATKTMHQIDVDALKANLAGEYTNESGYYESSASFDLTLMDKASSTAIIDQQDFCDIFLYTKWTDGSKILMGLDYDGTDVVQRFEQEQTGHSFSRGGDNDATNIVTIGFKTYRDTLYTTIEPGSIPV